jgi:hypothetical protein
MALILFKPLCNIIRPKIERRCLIWYLFKGNTTAHRGPPAETVYSLEDVPHAAPRDDRTQFMLTRYTVMVYSGLLPIHEFYSTTL